MSYNEPYEVDLILNRFSIPLYVSSTYNRDEFIPQSSVSEFHFNLPWYLIFDNSLCEIDSSLILAECVNYKYDPDGLSLITDFSLREDPNCSFTKDRVGPGLYVYDPFSLDFISRSVSLPEKLSDFFKNSPLKPINFSGKTPDYSKTPVFTVCRGRSLEAIYQISTGQVSSAENLDYFFLRDEPPSLCEYPDLNTFLKSDISGVESYYYYDTRIESVPCNLVGKQISFDRVVSGLIILRLIKKLSVENYKEEGTISEDSSVVYYIYAPYPITDIFLSDSKPVISSFEVNDDVKWNLTIRNLYNETTRSAVTFSSETIDAVTKLPPEIFMNGIQSASMIYPKLSVNNQLNEIGSVVQIIGNSNIISGENGSKTSSFEGISEGEYLYIDLKLE